MVKKGARKVKKTKRKLKMSSEEKGRRRGGGGAGESKARGGGVVMALVSESPRNTSTSEPLGEPFPRRPKD